MKGKVSRRREEGPASVSYKPAIFTSNYVRQSITPLSPCNLPEKTCIETDKSKLPPESTLRLFWKTKISVVSYLHPISD